MKEKGHVFSSCARYDSVERSIMNDFRIFLDLINFIKYLNCPDCKDSGLYCREHRIEVEKILEEVESN
jgi:hypothetical protein